jgi:hypothetical protein
MSAAPEIGNEHGARRTDGECAGHRQESVLEGVHVGVTVSGRLPYESDVAAP